MKQREHDIVSDILERVEQAVMDFLSRGDQGFDQATVEGITQRIREQDALVRRDWARMEPYIPARAPEREEAKRQAIEEASRTGRVGDASKKHGISRSTLYRLLKKTD